MGGGVWINKSDYLWLCPICNVYFNKNNGDKQKHIQEEIKQISKLLEVLNKEE